MSQLNLEKPTQLIPWAYNEKDQGWQKFAALAPLASKCAQEGDKVAQSILEHAAFALFVCIQLTQHIVDVKNRRPSVL